MLSLNKPEYKPLAVRELALVKQNRNESPMQATAYRDTQRLHQEVTLSYRLIKTTECMVTQYQLVRLVLVQKVRG